MRYNDAINYYFALQRKDARGKPKKNKKAAKPKTQKTIREQEGQR